MQSSLARQIMAWLGFYLFFMAVWVVQDEITFENWLKVSLLVLTQIPVVTIGFLVWDKPERLLFRILFVVIWVTAASQLMFDLDLVRTHSSRVQHLINYGVITFVALTIRGAARSVRLNRARELAEQRALSAQLAPHTLYNLLNIIYAATKSDPDKAGALILQLSEMMRHITSAAEQDFLPAHQEWQFLQSYATFARERTVMGSDIRLEASGDLEAPLPVMLCATLFENAVKHALAADHMTISAQLEMRAGGFRFAVENAVAENAGAVDGMGVGQAAVQSRLQHLYGRHHSFKAGLEEGRYRVEVAAW